LQDEPKEKKLTPEQTAKMEKKRKKKRERDITEEVACIRRIMKDLKELTMCSGDFPNVSACPLEDNIFLWHANVTAPDGPLKGLCVHFEIRLPSSYPRNPPKIRVLTSIRHPNVFGDWICLSMLRKRKYTEEFPHEAWSGAYTIASILLQLQSFLFDENVPQDGGYNKNNYIQYTHPRRLYNFKCARCGHCGKKPFPPIQMKYDHDFLNKEEQYELEWEVMQEGNPTVFYNKQARKLAKTAWVQEKISSMIACAEAKKVEKLADPNMAVFPGKEVAHILAEFLDPYEIWIVSFLYPSWETIKEDYNLQEKYESQCFYTKMDYREAALGVGVKVQYDPFKPKEIRQLSSDLDLISWHAWNKLKSRISAWGNECDLYIPMVLNESHMRNSGPLMWRQLRKLAVVDPDDEDHDARILDSICALMNSMVVGLLKTEGEVRMYHSEKALQGYCRFHQLLLQVCKERPGIRELAEKNVEKFIKNPRARHKKETPDLGRLLVMLSVSEKYGWEDIKSAFFEEVTVRQAKWYIMACPTLRFDVDTRNYGDWYRVMKPVNVKAAPSETAEVAKDRGGRPVRMLTDGRLVHGCSMRNGWIRLDNPCRGFVHPGNEEKLILQKLPFMYPALCKTTRDAVGRQKKEKESFYVRTIKANTYCVVVDIVGNRALVASVKEGKPQTDAMNRRQHFGRAMKTIWGCLLLDDELDATGNNGKVGIVQDACWVSLETAKGMLLEKIEIPDDWRLDRTFKEIQVSRELIMFQKAFLNVIKEGKTLAELSQAYLSKWGNPPYGSLPTLHSQVKKIKTFSTWNEYLKFLKLPGISKADMIELCKRSVAMSERKRYTRSFHTGFDEIPDIKKHKPKTKKCQTFITEDLGDDYVSRYAKKPKTRDPRESRERNRSGRDGKRSNSQDQDDSDSGSSQPAFQPKKKMICKKVMKNGRLTYIKGELHSLFLPNLPKDVPAFRVEEQLRKLIPRAHKISVPATSEGYCRGFGFCEMTSLAAASKLVQEKILFKDFEIQPRFSR